MQLASVRAGVAENVNFYVTYPESSRWDDEAYRESLAETLRHQYGGLRLDLVMAVSYPALQFTLQYRHTMFPGTKISNQVAATSIGPLSYVTKSVAD
jgi:hypothetical protein